MGRFNTNISCIIRYIHLKTIFITEKVNLYISLYLKIDFLKIHRFKSLLNGKTKPMLTFTNKCINSLYKVTNNNQLLIEVQDTTIGLSCHQ